MKKETDQNLLCQRLKSNAESRQRGKLLPKVHSLFGKRRWVLRGETATKILANFIKSVLRWQNFQNRASDNSGL